MDFRITDRLSVEEKIRMKVLESHLFMTAEQILEKFIRNDLFSLRMPAFY